MRHAQDDLAEAEAGASGRGAAGGAAADAAPERAAGGAPEHAGNAQGSSGAGGDVGDPVDGRGDPGGSGAPAGEDGEGYPAAQEGYDPTEGMNPRQRKLWELQQRLAASRRANQDAVVAEKRRKVRWPYHCRLHLAIMVLCDGPCWLLKHCTIAYEPTRKCSVTSAEFCRRGSACMVVWGELKCMPASAPSSALVQC